MLDEMVLFCDLKYPSKVHVLTAWVPMQQCSDLEPLEGD
jgi:hypothetical protein